MTTVVTDSLCSRTVPGSAVWQRGPLRGSHRSLPPGLIRTSRQALDHPQKFTPARPAAGLGAPPYPVGSALGQAAGAVMPAALH
ncbi:MAG: hypothetical protein ACREOS_10390, partial [Candidatus Dormibacteraceae bacterium]